MKITVNVRRDDTQEIEVEFPLYLQNQDCAEAASWKTYMRIDADGRQIVITKRSYGANPDGVECDVRHLNLRSDLGGYVGDRSDYWALDAARFDSELAAFKERLP